VGPAGLRPVASARVLRHVNSPGAVSIACEVTGQGPPLVLVHGAGSARWGFDLLRPLLEDSFTVMAVDRRGRGDSGDGALPYSIDQEFADVAAVMTQAGNDAMLFGHSYGGLVAAGAAALLPDLDKLVLYEPPMGGVLAAESWIERYERQLEAGERPAAVRCFLGDVGGYSAAEIAQMESTPAWGKRLAVASTVPRELRAERALALESLDLGALTARCLMLVGSESPAWAQRSTEAYAGALTDVRVCRLEGHGHGGAVSAPEWIARELIRA
jgi:pimeloyl-ACP methyl ester carboxylesterase